MEICVHVTHSTKDFTQKQEKIQEKRKMWPEKTISPFFCDDDDDATSSETNLKLSLFLREKSSPFLRLSGALDIFEQEE